MRALGRIGIVARLIGGRNEELEALGVTFRCAGPAVHVAAADPLGAGSDPDLISATVVTRGGTGRVGAVSFIITWRGGVIAAGVAHGIVDRIVPVVVVIGAAAVPAAVVRFERRVVPLRAGVLVRDHDPLSGVTHRPHCRSIDVTQPPLHGSGAGGVCLSQGGGIIDPANWCVGFDGARISPRRQCFDHGLIAIDDEHVGCPEGTVPNAASVQPPA